ILMNMKIKLKKLRKKWKRKELTLMPLFPVLPLLTSVKELTTLQRSWNLLIVNLLRNCLTEKKTVLTISETNFMNWNEFKSNDLMAPPPKKNFEANMGEK